MKALIHVLPLVIIAICSFTASGQTTNVADKDLTWMAGSLTDRNYSKNLSSPHRLVTHGRSTMELHRGSEQTLTFTILSVSGTWSDEKTAGKLEYGVRSSNGVLGKVTVERKGSSITAWVDFTQTNKNGLNIELKIDTIE